jgi:hypothetical protein
MKSQQPGNPKMPDFNKLTDRMIVEQPTEPMLVIKTNLDPKSSLENNPYYRSKNAKASENFREYFEQE